MKDSEGPTRDVASQASPSLPVTDEVQTVIGRFRLLEKIGEGGFGAVFVAEQKHPIKRRVALKIIKLGMDTKEVIARFEAERQALAMMDHPNIAKVLDAGATDTGRPYFVMELVHGIPITGYCDQNKLPPEKRLALFIDVCHAIQHAHQKGVIHRDIKPSNILVTLNDGLAVPKVIDFGIVKATQGDLTDKTIYTQVQQFVGTPAYMSPEQAEMSAMDVDTRSDIYSLGVLLYELMTGTTPFDAKELLKAGVDEMRRRIRETEPQRPSNRLSGMTGSDSTNMAERRGMEARRLITLLRGDLDWIVMKCLEKDRTRRYETSNGLALDIGRYLNNEPIAARPPSSAYRFWKLVRRNKMAFGAAAAVVLAILVGLGLAMVGFVRANSERIRAEAALAVADDNFRQARAAVEDLLRISDERLKDQTGLQPLRMELMKAAIDRYEPFLAKPSSDPTPRAQLARLYARYGLELLQQSEVLDQTVMNEFEKATLQGEALGLPFMRRGLELNMAILADLRSSRPEAYQPQRPKGDQGRMFEPSAMWAEFDVAQRSAETATFYRLLGDWRHAAEMSDLSMSCFKDLVEHNPSVATFRRYLASSFRSQVEGAEQAGDRNQLVAASKDVVAFWTRQVDLHPDMPALKEFADEATKLDAGLSRPSTQPSGVPTPSTKP